MKIKRFYADTLRDALKQVKEALGADAVILSNSKTTSGGVELVAAIDYNENAYHKPRNTTTQAAAQKVENPVLEARNNQEWLQELKKMQTVKPLAAQDEAEALKNDVVSFSQAREQFARRQEPRISEDKVDSVLADQNQFSALLQEKKARLVAQTRSAGKHPETLDQTKDDTLTYSKPQTKVKSTTQRRRATNNVRTSQAKNKPVQWSQDPMLVEMKAEIQSLKELLHHQVSGLAWGHFNRRYPHHTELLQRLYKLGIKPSLCKVLLKYVDESGSLEQSWKKSLALISQGIRVAEQDILEQGGVIALVGPTGVGKTTTIAKLASRFTLRYGARELALISTDSFRVGAQEQLKTYGQLLQVPVYTVADAQTLAQTLKRLQDKRLVLIDTAGMNQRDIRLTQQLAMLRRADKQIKLISVLSAAAQSSVIHEVCQSLKPYKPDGCVVTKLDESTSLGGILSVLMEQQLLLHYITDGQKVPEDIHPARVSQILKKAMAIVREYQDAYDYNDIAFSFTRELQQVNA